MKKYRVFSVVVVQSEVMAASAAEAKAKMVTLIDYQTPSWVYRQRAGGVAVSDIRDVQFRYQTSMAVRK